MTSMATTTEAVSVGHKFGIVEGDWFVDASWGYDQTNASFYQVLSVSKSGKSVTVQEYLNHTVEQSEGPGHLDTVEPDMDRPFKEPRTFRLIAWSDTEARFRTDRYRGAPCPHLILPRPDGLPRAGQTNSIEGH